MAVPLFIMHGYAPSLSVPPLSMLSLCPGMKSLTYAYVGRRLKKRDFRQLWITRISAAVKAQGMNYSSFMHGLKVAGIQINRKMLSEMAINDTVAFAALCDIAKKAI